MALFSKPPAKRPLPPPPEARPVPPAPKRPSARELASQAQGRSKPPAQAAEPGGGDITVTGASLLDFAPAQAGFEVAQANPGLCAVLENAALLYASGQSAPARSLLEQGVQTDHDTKLSPLAWLALFDLLQRAGDRAAFEQCSLQYVVQFERSAPAWEERGAPAAKAAAAGYIAFSSKLTAASSAQVDMLKRAIDRGATGARVDFGPVMDFDEDGVRLVAEALALARRRRCPLVVQKPERLKLALGKAVKRGREGGEGAWLLALELLQWSQDHVAFEDLALEYAMAFEVSPPSWEPPPVPPAPPAAAVEVDPAAARPAPAEGEILAWSGTMTGSALPHFVQLADFAQRRTVVPVDMGAVDRVDFVCAGAMLNAINRVEAQRKSVQLVGVSPIVRALLLLIGVSPRHFVKKAS